MNTFTFNGKKFALQKGLQGQYNKDSIIKTLDVNVILTQFDFAGNPISLQIFMKNFGNFADGAGAGAPDCSAQAGENDEASHH